MIGIVVVSHSRALGEAAVALAAEMVPEEARPRIAVAAGLDETTFGTDAVAISEAITEVDSPDGVLVLMDLGSALLSAEMALEFIDPDVAARVRLSAAPLVEGLVSALVTASTGADIDEVAAEAAGALAPKADQLGSAVPGSEPAEASAPGPDPGSGPNQHEGLSWQHTVRNPHGLHARPAAALVSGLRGLDATVRLTNATTGAGPADARSIGRVAALGLRCGHVLAATIQGPDAQAALDRLSGLAADDFGEATTSASDANDDSPASLGTGRQVVVGPARVLAASVDTTAYAAGDPSAEGTRLAAAVATVEARLRSLTTGPHADIFRAQQALLADPELTEQFAADVASGASAVEAVATRADALAAVFAGLDDPYLRDRAEDVRSLRNQLHAALMGVDLDADAAAGPHILVVAELDAATAAGLEADTLAVITTHGGATGHGVIVASSRGIPVLTGWSAAADLVSGTTIAVDAAARRLWVSPSDEDLAEIARLAEARDDEAKAAAAASHDEARTASGTLVLVEANIASRADAKAAAAAGADGSGLVRTELLFADCPHPGGPTEDDQARLFVEIGRLLGRTITIRTWDPGGDKPLPFLAQAPETNPMLGERGIRAMQRREDLFRTQLRAVALAAKEIDVRVMFPMVTEPDEIVWARTILDEVVSELGGGFDVGMMIEVPAAAVRAVDFVPLVDFVSIGTNDLTQYATASDRGNGVVSHLARAESPAVLDLIALVGTAFAGKPVAVCGDLASNPDLTAALVSRGVTELSVRPPLVGLVKAAVRRIGS
jgi:phosphocarrier protein FPr